MKKYADELNSAAVEARLKDDRQSGIRSGVNGTPTFYINGLRYDGPPDFDSMLETLEMSLKEEVL